MQNQSSLERVAVTGAGGFLGRHLARALFALECDPLLLVNTPLEKGFSFEARQAKLDLTDPKAVTEVLERERPATLFHLAGTRALGHERPWSDCVELNVAATVHLLDAARRAEVQRVIIIGSADEYGNQPGPLRETLPLLPVSPYAVSKAAATRFAQAMYERDGCPVVILRPFTVYGPRQPVNMFVSEAIDCALRGEAFRMTEGTQRRDLVYLDDAIRAFIAAAQATSIDGRVINIGSGEAHALRDVAKLIWRLSESEAPLLIGARPAAPSEVHDTWADISVAHESLGWEPRVSLEAGLTAMIEWTRNNLAASERECPTK